jgi:hypothetical protein
LSGINSTYMAKVQDDVNTVYARFPDLKENAPTNMTDGADMEKFNIENMMKIFKDTNIYKANVNVAWLSLASPTPELPLSTQKLESLKSLYQQPKAIAFIIHVGVDKDISKLELGRLIKEGQLPLAEPVEKLHAWWSAFADAVRAEADDEVMRLWLHAALSQTCMFTDKSEAGRSWSAMQARETLTTEYEALRTTPLMRVLHFSAFKEKLEAAQGSKSAAFLATEYLKNLTLSRRTEPVTASWVDMACTFLSRVFSIPRLRDLIIAADDLPAGTNPLEGTTRLQTIINKAKSADKIILVVESLLDMRRAGFLSLA